MIKIISDSTSDLTAELIKKYDIDILPLYVHMGEDEYRDGVDITPDEIYEWSDANKTTPKTAAPSIEDAVNVIKPYKEKKCDVIMFAISEDMSSSANVMRLAADELEYSDHVYVIDSASLSTGIGLMVLEAAVMADKGIPAEEIVKQIEALKPYVRASFVVDTLKYLHRGGRCSSTAMLVGSALKLKPRIVVKNGKMEADHKYRGKQSRVVMQYVKELEPELLKAKKDRVFITHSGCADEIIKEVKDYLKGLGHFKELFVTRAGGVISSHCGAGTLGVLYIAGGEKFGPYDKEFDINKNGIMEEDEKAAEAAYIRHIVETEKKDAMGEEEEE